MATLSSDNKRSRSLRQRLRNLTHQLKRTLIHEWPAALFVAGLVGIAQTYVPWLKRVEFSTLASVAELGARSESTTAVGPEVWIYTIERADFDTRYGGRTPLDRCNLEEDLKVVYEAIEQHNEAQRPHPEATAHPGVEFGAEGAEATGKIDLLVVDLDLSPIDQPSPTEAVCQGKLERLLQEGLKHPDGSTDLIRTVLMQPIDAEANPSTRHWIKQQESRNIVFGNARYPIREDMAAYYYCDPASLAAIAHFAAGGSGTDCLGRTAAKIAKITCHSPCDPGSSAYEERADELRIEEQEFINPTKYRKQIVLKSIRSINADGNAQSSDRGPNPRAQVKAVFFGVDLDADRHSTPIGVLTGVQINAATFLSLIDPISSEHHFVGFAIDVLVGLAFALLVTLYWRFFFEDRITSDPAGQTLAGLWLIGLGFVWTALLIVFMRGSALALQHGVWFSPLPIALGMLFDAAVAGSVAHVIERDGGSHGPSTLRNSAIDLFGGKFDRLRRAKHYTAAGVEACYLAVWVTVLVCGLFPESLKGLLPWLQRLLP